MVTSGLSGSGSGLSNTVPDLGDVATIKTGFINKSPVLYLRRRRNTDFNRYKDTVDKMKHGQMIWARGKVDPVLETVDQGDIYPNHESTGRIGNVEWIKFRDYKRKRPKWIRSVQLVIDGTCKT